MILHSKITPERPQITTDHTRSSQNHELGTNIFSLLSLAKQIFFTVTVPCLSPLSVSLCLLRAWANVKEYLHWSQAWGFSPLRVSVFWDFEPFWRNICTDNICRHFWGSKQLRTKSDTVTPPYPKPRETPHSSNGPTVAVFCFKSGKTSASSVFTTR